MTPSQVQNVRKELRLSWNLLKCSGWQPLLAVHLCFLLASAVVLTPLMSLSVQAAVSFSGQEALSDTDIASFFLSPGGAIAGIVLASLLLMFALMGYATLLIPAHAVQCGEKTTLAATFARLVTRGPSLLRMSLRIILRYLVVSIPFVIALGATYWLLLTDNDINYYLAEKPPEFLIAVAIALVALLALGVVLIRITVTWFYSIPLVLFAGESGKLAKIHSAKASIGHRKSIALWLALWLFGTPLLNFIITGPITLTSNWLMPQLADRLPLLALVIGGSVVLSTLLAFAISFLTLCLLAHQNIRMFKNHGLDPTAQKESSDAMCHRIFQIPVGEKLLLTLGFLAMALIGLICYNWLEQIEFQDDAMVIAHRGASMTAPENTLAAIQKAVDEGADWVEIDVQETADGKVVVFHDSDFKRLGGKSLSLWDATSQQLPDIDIGSWFDPKFSKETTPSLVEVLDVCRGKSGVLIELKYYGHDQQLEQRVIDIVEKAKMENQIMVMSLSYAGIQKVRKLRPHWRVGLLSTVALGDITQLDVDFLGLNSRAATKRLIERAHQNDIDIYVWTVNDPIDISTMTSRGVDGLITDAPDVARNILHQRKELKPSERLMLELAHIFGKRSAIKEQ